MALQKPSASEGPDDGHLLGASSAAVRRGSAAGRPLSQVLGLTDDQRAFIRGRGRLVGAALMQHLDAPGAVSAARALDPAAGIAADYGRVAASLGLSLSQTAEGFLRFRMPFLGELSVTASRRRADAAATTALHEAAERAIDRLLMAATTGYIASTD